MGAKEEVQTTVAAAPVADEVLKPVPLVEKIDYSGAHEKTDPREIALVKKLDRWIMASAMDDIGSPLNLLRRASPCCSRCTF